MKPGDDGAAKAWRLWWAAPLALAIITAVVFVAVVLPALAGGAHVPDRLVVHRSPGTAQTPSPATTSATPKPSRSTTVVPPEQPVVRESDDRHENRNDDSGRHRSGGGGDG